MTNSQRETIVNKLYLNIAGFNIRISLFPEQKKPDYRTIDLDLSTLFKGFVIAKPRSIDFEIILKRDPQIITYRKNPRDNNFFMYFFKKNKKTIETYAHISPFQLNFLISLAIDDLLKKETGFMIHASAVAKGTDALLFLGQSGAGKTTIAKLLSDKFKRISDDMIIIRKIKGRYLAYETFFNDRNYIGIKKKGSYRIAGIFFLNKSKKIIASEITDKPSIFKELIPQIAIGLSSKDRKIIFKETLELAENFENFYRLDFPKDKRTLEEFFTKRFST